MPAALNSLTDFFVSIGFDADELSARKAIAKHKDVESRLTKQAEDAKTKRAKLDTDEAADRAKRRQEALKREEEHHAKSLKGLQAYALKASGFAVKAFATIEAGALGVVYAVDRAAKSFERLNYTGMRSGATAGKVGAFGYAAGQLGSSQEEAEGQLQTFGQNLKLNSTGYARALERLGVKTRDANGHLRDSVDLATDLGDALRKIEKRGPYGYANAMNQARVFGFDGDTARALMNPEFRKRSGQFGADQGKIGANIDEASKSGTAFEQSMRRLLEVLEQIGTKINGVLFVKLKPLLDQLSTWFLENGQKIADIVGQLADDLVKLAAAIGEKLADADWKTILGNIEGLAKSFGSLLGKLGGDAGLVAKIGALVVALGLLSRLAMPPWALALLGIGAAASAGLDYLDREDKKPKSWEALKKEEAETGWFGTKFGAKGSNSAFRNRGRKAAIERDRVRRAGGGILQPFDGSGAGEGSGNLTKLTEDEARRAGIDPRIMHGIRAGESGHGPRYDHNGKGEDSWGPWQLNRQGGLGNDFERDTASARKAAGFGGLEDPRTIPMQTRWVAEYIKRHGRGSLGAWHGYHGDRDPSPRWGDSGYNPPAPTVTKIPPMLKKPMAGARELPGAASPSAPPQDPTRLQGGADGKPVQLGPSQTSFRGDTNITHNPTFHIAGGDAQTSLAAARLSASRGQQDLLRNVQGVLA